MTEGQAAEAYKLLAEGKKLLIVGDAVNAASRLQDATERLEMLFGAGTKECGEAYLYYGKALLQEARIEIGVFGGSVPGVKEQDDVEGSENENDDEGDGENGNNEEAEGETDTKETRDETEAEEKEDDVKTQDDGETGDATHTSSCDDHQTDETNVDQAGSSKMDENIESNNQIDGERLELAWEVLEAARVIFSSQSGQEDKLNEAEAHLRLAEVGQETGQYEQAVGDIQQCLAIQTSVLEPDDRQLAETYYLLAVGLGQANRFDDGVREFEQASRVLNMRIENITQRLQTANQSTASENAKEIEKERDELTELEAILPEIQERIDDFKESKRAIKEITAEALGLSGGLTGSSSATSESHQQSETGASTTGSVSNSKQVNDISHLVKRKRKAPAEDTEVKRARNED